MTMFFRRREAKISVIPLCGSRTKSFIAYLLKEEDPCVKRAESGFVIERTGREARVYEGVIDDLKILRDAYMAEIFVNGGRVVYTVLLKKSMKK